MFGGPVVLMAIVALVSTINGTMTTPSLGIAVVVVVALVVVVRLFVVGLGPDLPLSDVEQLEQDHNMMSIAENQQEVELLRQSMMFEKMRKRERKPEHKAEYHRQEQELWNEYQTVKQKNERAHDRRVDDIIRRGGLRS